MGSAVSLFIFLLIFWLSICRSIVDAKSGGQQVSPHGSGSFVLIVCRRVASSKGIKSVIAQPWGADPIRSAPSQPDRYQSDARPGGFLPE